MMRHVFRTAPGCFVMLVLVSTAAWAQASSSYARPESLVDTAWLAAHLQDPDVRIVDARRSGYEQGHVPGAVWLDIGVTRDASNPPTFLPSADAFARVMGELGISNRTHVVFYDDRGGVYGARPWAVLRRFGHEHVSIVNGGWQKWVAERRAVTAEVPIVPAATFVPGDAPGWIATADDVLAAIDAPATRILDVRTAAEIDGTDLRGIARGGYIPTAAGIDWESTLEGEFMTIRPAADLYALFRGHGIAPTDTLITYCEGGGRSAHELFVLHLLGYDALRLYLGSWQDWGNRPDLPLATVAADGRP